MSAVAIQSRQLLKAREVAAMLSVTEMHVYNLSQKRKLASFKIGSARRYRIEDVEAYMAESYTPADEKQEKEATADVA